MLSVKLAGPNALAVQATGQPETRSWLSGAVLP
jgi:hypothetical protein